MALLISPLGLVFPLYQLLPRYELGSPGPADCGNVRQLMLWWVADLRPRAQ